MGQTRSHLTRHACRRHHHPRSLPLRVGFISVLIGGAAVWLSPSILPDIYSAISSWRLINRGGVTPPSRAPLPGLATMAWRSSGASNSVLINNLAQNGLIKSDRVRKAMLAVRVTFLSFVHRLSKGEKRVARIRALDRYAHYFLHQKYLFSAIERCI